MLILRVVILIEKDTAITLGNFIDIYKEMVDIDDNKLIKEEEWEYYIQVQETNDLVSSNIELAKTREKFFLKFKNSNLSRAELEIFRGLLVNLTNKTVQQRPIVKLISDFQKIKDPVVQDLFFNKNIETPEENDLSYDLLIERLRNSSRIKDRIDAIHTLAKMKTQEAIIELINAMFNNTCALVRRKAFKALCSEEIKTLDILKTEEIISYGKSVSKLTEDELKKVLTAYEKSKKANNIDEKSGSNETKKRAQDSDKNEALTNVIELILNFKKYDYYIVNLSLNLSPNIVANSRLKFSSSSILLEFYNNSSSNIKTIEMYPKRIVDKQEVQHGFNISPKFIYNGMEISFDRIFHYKRRFKIRHPKVQASYLLEPRALWSVFSTTQTPLLGSQSLFLILQVPKKSEVKAKVKLGVKLKYRGLLEHHNAIELEAWISTVNNESKYFYTWRDNLNPSFYINKNT